MLLLILAVLWGIVLIPPALRSRAEHRRVRSVDVFRRRLEKLAPPMSAAAAATRPPGARRPAGAARSHVAVVASPAVLVSLPPAAPAPDPVIPPVPAFATRVALLQRRRRVLGGLLAAAVVLLAAGMVSGRPILVMAHVGADAAVVGYVLGLRRLSRLRRLAVERAAKVRYLPVSGGLADVVAGPDFEVATGPADATVPLRRSASS